ncbi:MAG: penicillin-binding transpeptidase domain-containing protein [Saccharofermentanales bacterium]|jgi:penicillin-binding protein 2
MSDQSMPDDRGVLSFLRGRTRKRSSEGGRSRSSQNRYLILSILIILAFMVMLLRTSSLQLFGEFDASSPETWGSVGSIVIPAPRGDVVDRNGLPLAVSETLQGVALVNTGMTEASINRTLLDLARLFSEYGCAFESPLLNWLDVEASFRGVDLLEKDTSLRFVFRKPYDSIVRWQTDRDLFNLIEEDKAVTYYEKQRIVREDPNDFFYYLLYDFFNIEPDRTSGSRLYSDGEAFVIMQLRYLLLEQNWNFVSGQPVLLVDNVSSELAAYFTEQNYRFPGVIIVRHYKRRYTDDSRYVGHALGYIGAISASEYNVLKTSGYAINDTIGKSGVEQAAESYLRGRSGLMTLDSWQEDESGGVVLIPGEIRQRPSSGSEVKMTIDLDLQKVARAELERKIMEFRGSTIGERAMKATDGCVIVMDAKTGAILVNANYPDFDPSDFVDQFDNPEAARRVQALLTGEERQPLINRGISATYTPGSTFKPITGMAALETGTITASNNVLICHGEQDIGGYVWHCSNKEGHGPLNFKSALVTSCNLYFYQIGVETGIDNIKKIAESLGLGKKTGIDIEGEVAGVFPTRELKKQLNPLPVNQNWYFSDTCQVSIGQLYNSYTMLQMARAIGGIATNQLVTPHLIKEVVDQDGLVVVPERIERTPLNFKDENVALLRSSMVGLSQNKSTRTGLLFSDFPYAVACKTGTAEAFNEDMEQITNSVFVCFAPADDPEIVIAHVISDGAYGVFSADISYRILCAYFGVEPTHDHMGSYDDYTATPVIID